MRLRALKQLLLLLRRDARPGPGLLNLNLTVSSWALGLNARLVGCEFAESGFAWGCYKLG